MATQIESGRSELRMIDNRISGEAYPEMLRLGRTRTALNIERALEMNLQQPRKKRQ